MAHLGPDGDLAQDLDLDGRIGRQLDALDRVQVAIKPIARLDDRAEAVIISPALD